MLLACLLIPWTAFAQQRPLRTDDAELLQTGHVRADVGVEFLQGQKFSLSGLDGDLTRLGVASIHVGLGYAEFEISGVGQDLYSVSSRTDNPPISPKPPKFSGTSSHDFGDLVLGTKIRLAGEKEHRPAVSFKFAVELPNEKHDSGLGTDQTEFYSSILLKKHFGRSQLMGDIGFAILGSPVLMGRQDDPLTYGAAVITPLSKKINLVAEISGRQGPPARLGNENRSQARLGIQFWIGAIRWDLAAVAGLMHYDPRSGVVVGMSYEFQAFQGNESPVKLK